MTKYNKSKEVYQDDICHYFGFFIPAGVYLRPRQVTPCPETTFHAEVNIMAAKTPAPSGVVHAYQRGISISPATNERI